MKNIKNCEFNMDTGCVELRFQNGKWKCTECGHKNSISADDIYESEEDFRNPDN